MPTIASVTTIEVGGYRHNIDRWERVPADGVKAYAKCEATFEGPLAEVHTDPAWSEELPVDCPGCAV